MASRILLRPQYRIGAAFCSIAGASLLLQRPLMCDPGTEKPGRWNGFSNDRPEARVPIIKESRLNPQAVRQISFGSIAGFAAGLAVSVFSKPLTFLLGLLIFGVAFIERRGVNVIPYNRIQRYFSNVNARSAARDNLALKLSFGSAFVLAGFARFN